MDAAPAALATWAQALEQKLAHLHEQLDPAHHARSMQTWQWLAQLPAGAARRRLAARLFEQHVAPLPDLARMADRHARVALLPREQILRQLCMLALARRPGALRCCIERQARQDLQAQLGAGYERLMSVSCGGRAPPEHTTRWTPMHWSCVGFFDWAALLHSSDRALRRLVRLSLPLGLLDVRRKRPQHSDLKSDRAVQVLDQLGLEWSC